MGRLLLCWLLACLSGGASVAAQAENTSPVLPSPRPLGQSLTVYQPELPRVELPEMGPILSLKQARQLVLLYNPEFQSLSWEIRAHQADLLQAGLGPNPEIGLLSEDILGSTIWVPKDFPQTTLQATQVFMTAGKIQLDQALARLTVGLAGWDFEKKRLALLTEVTARYIDVLEAQEYLSLTRELQEIAQATLTVIKTQVEKGKVSPLEQNRAQVVLANTRLELEQAEMQLALCRENLASLWGGGGSEFERVAGELRVQNLQLPSLASLLARLHQHPDLARWQTEFEHRKVRSQRAQAQAYPDLSLTGGLRHHHQSNDWGILLGVALPMPILNANQGGIQEAQLRQMQAIEEKERAQFSLQAELKGAYQRLLRSQLTLQVLENEILPQAEATFLAMRAAYTHGKFSYLEVLESQRNFFESRRQGVTVLSDFYQALSQLEYLISEELGGAVPAVEQRLGVAVPNPD